MTAAPSEGTALSPFRYPVFRAIWLASLSSNFGIWVQSVGAAWLMTTIAPSPDMVASVQSATALPVLLFSLLGGALADLWDRRKVYLLGQSIVLTVSALLSWLDHVGLVTPWLLLGLTFALDSGSALRQPAYQATVSELVPRAELPAAIALNSLGFNITRALGPGLGGLIVGALGVQAAFLFNALSNIFIIAVLVRWRRPIEPASMPREHLLPAMLAGVRYVAGSPVILTVMARAFIFTAIAGGSWALLPLVAKQSLGGGAFTYGLLLGMLGVGAVASAPLVGRLRRLAGNERLVDGALVAYAVAMAALAWAPGVWPLVPFLALGGGAWLTALSSFNVMVQLSAANWVKARTLSIYFMAMFGGLAFGSWAWGVVADRMGVGPALGIEAGLLLASLVLSVPLRLPHAFETDMRPATLQPMPSLAPGIDPGDGAVSVTVEYRIAAHRVTDFQAVMRDLRRVRKRDGAVRWTLYQDAADATRWIEAFILPSWWDDLRQATRTTVADHALFQSVRSLHQGREAPRVSHWVARVPAPGWPPGRTTALPGPVQPAPAAAGDGDNA